MIIEMRTYKTKRGMRAKVLKLFHTKTVAEHCRQVALNLQSAIRNLQSAIPRGHSSVGRAPALQAGSQGFESPCLQSLQGVEAKSPKKGNIIGCTSGSVIPLPQVFRLRRKGRA